MINKMRFIPLAFPLALFSGSVLVLFIVNFVVRSPYMDEIFHVDQIRRYCRGRFDEWNEKITTPPALYVVSYIFWRIVNWVSNTPVLNSLFVNAPIFDCQSVASLRFLNVLFLVPLYLVICGVLRTNWRTADYSNPVILHSTALNLCIFPLLYFTAFLYYTDVLSTLTVLSMYYFHLRRCGIISALIGAVSCSVRQTNIIWVAFCAYLTVLDVIVDSFRRKREKSKIGEQKRQEDRQGNEDVDDVKVMMIIFSGIKDLIQNSAWSEILALLWAIFRATWAYITVAIGFVLFIVWNGGVVLGDRSAHQACLHIVQFCYYAIFTMAFGFFVIFSKSNIKAIFTFILRRPVSSILIFTIILVIVHWFTFDHPYLLADNRHYTFYIWRRWFMRHEIMKYLLIPAYFCCFYLISNSLMASGNNTMWIWGYFGCVFLVTAPNRLLEFRYFILPYFFCRLHIGPMSKLRLSMEFLFFFLINAVTVALFLLKPFKWSNSDEWQRFMW